jgi:hypothetical protein
MNILTYLMIALGVLLGGGSTLVILVTMLVTLCYKIYRKIKYGISLYN